MPPPAARLQRNLLQHLQLSLDANIEDAVKGDRTTRKIVRVARNEACPCGSGKKYKHCHGAIGTAQA